ncbi:MAG: TonB-dependent receptor [Flavobacteriales bacterium]
MKRFFIIGIMYWCLSPLYAQNIISGRVLSAEDAKPLSNAIIHNDELHLKYKTGYDGNFHIDISKKDNLTLVVSAPGHVPGVLQPRLGNNFYEIYLHKVKGHLEEFVITAVSSLKLKRSVSSHIVNKAADLQSNNSTNIIDALTINPSISQITTGGSVSKPVIRGLGYNRVVVAKNGIRQEDQQWGEEHGIQIDANDVDRIEILNGPSTLLFGSDALGGVINISTEKRIFKDTVHGKLFSQYQTNNGLGEIAFTQEGRLRNLLWDVSLSTLNARNYTNKYDGRVFNTAFENRNFSGTLGYQYTWGTTHLFMSGFHQKTGINNGERDENGRFTRKDAFGETIPLSDKVLTLYQIFYPYQKLSHYMIHLKQDILLGRHKVKLNLAYQRNNRRELEHINRMNQLLLQTCNYDLKYHLPDFDRWKVTLGINGMFQKNNSLAGAILIPNHHFLDVGGLIHVMKTFKKLHLEGGLRYDTRGLHSISEGGALTRLKHRFDAMSGSAGFSYTLWPTLIFKANYARGFRAPSLIELTVSGDHIGANRFELGNPDLHSETNHQIDIGSLYDNKSLHIELSTFYNRIHGFIFSRRMVDLAGLPEKRNGYEVFQYYQNDAQLYGWEILCNFHPEGLSWLQWNNSLGLVKGQFIQAKVTAQRYIPRIPATKWRSELQIKFDRWGHFIKKTFLKLGYVRYFAQNEVFSAYNTETPTPTYGILHAGIGTTFTDKKGKELFELYILGDNLLNVVYQSHLDRYKYIGINPITGRQGMFNMGRNITFKLVIPLKIL